MSQAMEHEGFYRIEVRGTLEKRVIQALGGLRASSRSEGDDSLILLEGRLPDQAALAGLLQALLQLDVSLVSMRMVDD